MLKSVLKGVQVSSITGTEAVKINRIELDSRKVEHEDLFVAIRGAAADGHQFIEKATERGASVVVCETLPEHLSKLVTYIQVPDSSKALGTIASNFYGNPSTKLKLVGVTGTNGKTTTVTLLFDMFRKLGYKVGLISTVVYKINNLAIHSERTTPDAVSLNRMMAEMVEAGCQYCFMEVSSHSLIQHRIEGLSFVGGLFTNITLDHLDYHKTFAEYIKAKKLFFDNYLPKGAFALVNTDDRNGTVMVQNTRATVKTYALKSIADYQCRIMESLFDGMLLQMDQTELWVRFIGEFNAYNLLGVYAIATELGIEKEDILKTLSQLKSVSGRFEYQTSPSGITAIVDYAHTPDALQNVLETTNKIKTDKQRLITVVGCGGNRDKSKRPIMARIAVEKSDFVIFTSDNPRFESAAEIIEEMLVGIQEPAFAGKYVAIENRHEAIKMAIIMAKGVDKAKVAAGEKGDIVIIAGKGHENYQEIGAVKHHFDDKEEVRKLFEA